MSPAAGVDAVDAALRAAEAAIRDASASLVALEEHPGYRLLRTWPLRGRSARRWEEITVTVADLHADFGRYREVVARARAARGTRPRPGPAELDEVDALLHGESVVLADEEIPLPRRGLLGPAAEVHRIRPPDLLARMAAAFDAATALVAHAAAVWDAVAARLDPVDAVLDAAARTLDEGGGPSGGPSPRGEETADPVLVTYRRELTALRDEVATLRREAFGDPLALRPDHPLDEARVAAAAARADGLRETVRPLGGVRAAFPDRLRAFDDALDALARDEAAAAEANAAVARAIAGDHPRPPPPRADGLRRRRDEAGRAAEAGRWAGADAVLRATQDEIAGVAAVARAHRDERREVLERRAELRGRLTALAAKATARGRAEDLALDALRVEAHDRLWSAPCDLAAATVALRRYQRALEQPPGEGP